MREEWVKIGCCPFHEVSSQGRVRTLSGSYNTPSTRVLSPCAAERGGGSYLVVNLHSKVKYVHRLVLEGFVGACPLGCEADHRDRNRHNNKLGNLRWLLKEDNNPHRKLCGGEVWLVRRLLAGNIKQGLIAQMFRVDASCISRINIQDTWKEVNHGPMQLL